MKSKGENITFEEYIKLRQTHRVRETKKIIKQSEKENKDVKKRQSEEEKQEAKEAKKIGIVKREKNENLVPETLKIAKVLKDSGVNLGKIHISKRGKYLTLGEIEQDEISVQKIIEEKGLDREFKFGRGVYIIRCSCKGTGTDEITEEEKREAEELGLLEKENSISVTLKIARILNDEGVDFRKIQLSKNNKFILLEEIEQDGIDMQKIIEKNKLDGKFKLGMNIAKLRSAYNYSGEYKMSEEERKEAEELGLLEKESSIAKVLKLARILVDNGVDFTKLKTTKVINKKQEYILLKEIEQDGIDIQKIIEENKLDANFKLGMGIVNLRTAYKGSGTYRMTQEERKEAERLGLIPQELRRKVEQKQKAIEKNRKAKELYDNWMKRKYEDARMA